MTKKLKIEILQDGTIKAKTEGISGKECLKYIEILEKISESKTVDSEFLDEYYVNNKAVMAEKVKTNINEK